MLKFLGLDSLLPEDDSTDGANLEADDEEDDSSTEDISLISEEIDALENEQETEQATVADWEAAGYEIDTMLSDEDDNESSNSRGDDTSTHDDDDDDDDGSNSSDDSGDTLSDATDVDDIDQAECIEDFADQFIEMFCGAEQSDKFESLRRKEGAEFVRNLEAASDEMVSAILSKIHGAKLGG